MGVNPFNSYSPPPPQDPSASHLPLERQYPSPGDEAPCILRPTHLSPASPLPWWVFLLQQGLHMYVHTHHTYITHITHSSRPFLRKNASGWCFLFCHRGCFNGCWRSQWSVLRQGTEQGLATQRNESSCFQQCPGFRISACSECWEDLGEPRASGRLWSHFPSSVLAASPCGCSSCFSQPGGVSKDTPWEATEYGLYFFHC